MKDAIDFRSYEHRKRVNFINSLTGFKSVNLLGTRSHEYGTNLSIISSAFHLGADPALIGIIMRPDTVVRDSLENIRENEVYTLNHVNRHFFKQAHQTSARYDKLISEFDACEFNEQYLDDFFAPFVAESEIKMSLKLAEEIKIKQNGTHLLIGEVQNVYTDEKYISEDGLIDIEQAQTITVSGLDTYHTTEKLCRLSYAKVDKDPQEI